MYLKDYFKREYSHVSKIVGRLKQALAIISLSELHISPSHTYEGDVAYEQVSV